MGGGGAGKDIEGLGLVKDHGLYIIPIFDCVKFPFEIMNLLVNSYTFTLLLRSLKESYPWEPHSNDDADKCVSENESIQSSLTENMSEILKSVDLVDNFWTLLLQHNVVNVDMMRTIQVTHFLLI